MVDSADAPSEKPAPHVPKISLGKIKDSGEKKETPSLIRSATPVEEKVEAKPVLQEIKTTSFNEGQVQEAWTAFKEERLANGASDTEKLVLGRRLVKSDQNIKILLESQLEISILDKFEPELIRFLREKLDNTVLVLEKEVSEQVSTKNLYTSRDKFDYMAGINPTMRELKERLGLDFDY